MKPLMPIVLLAASLLSLPLQAATAFPTKPIRIIVA
jgi:tripartite-type tricarboxylate transporter receptor subunit TctC